MLTPESRKTMNERVTTGNLSFSSTREPSPTDFGDGSSSPYRDFPKTSTRNPVRTYHRANKKYSVKPEPAWFSPSSFIKEVSAQNTMRALSAPRRGTSISPSEFYPPCRRSLSHAPPTLHRRQAPKKRSIDSTFSYYHEINPLQHAHWKSSNDRHSFHKNRLKGPRTSRRSLSRSSRLLMQHPIQGLGK